MNSSPVRPSFAHSMSIGVDAAAFVAVMVFDHAGPAGQCQDLVVGDAQTARGLPGRTGTFFDILPPPTS